MQIQWFCHVPGDGDWPVDYDGTDTGEAQRRARESYAAGRLPPGSTVWSRLGGGGVTRINIDAGIHPIIAVGKSRRGYYYELFNGLQCVFADREKFRYALRNNANVPEAEQLTNRLG